VNHLPAATYLAVPWKNGRGVTRLVAVDPPEASLSDFRLRISVAAVVEDGPFSQFPGVDRWILTLDGAGIDLTVDGQVVAADPGNLAYFAGDAHTVGRLRAGPVQDLNVMVRRPHHARVGVMDAQMLETRQTTWVYVLRGWLGPAQAGDTLRLEPGDRVEGEARILVVEGG
jgi:hypothetical protein